MPASNRAEPALTAVQQPADEAGAGWRRFGLAVVVLAIAVLLLHAYRYLPFITDDALISLRYARRLLAGEGLTWTAGAPVEGYSNLLWVLLAASLGALGVDLIDAVRGLGVAGMVAVLVAMLSAHGSRRRDAFPWALLFGSLFLVLSRPIAVWTIGGLEQPLLAALVAWSLVLAIPLLEAERVTPGQLLRASLPLGLLCVTRPDGALFAAATAIALLIRGVGRQGLVLAAGLLSLPGLFVGAQLCFRLAYYDAWLPNTAHVKLGFSWRRVGEGLHYLLDGFAALGPLSLLGALALAFMLARREHRSRAILLLLDGSLWAVYVVIIGGDIFPASRHFVPLIVVLCWLVAFGVADLLVLAGTRRARSTALGLTGVAVAVFAGQQWTDDRDAEAFRDGGWEWSGQVVGLLLKRAFASQQPLFAVTAAGSLPYWSELPSLDMLGLNDRYLARHRPQDFGTGRLAHDLGDGAYVLQRRPDLISFCGPTGAYRACFPGGRQLQRLDEFHWIYTPVRLHGTIPRDLTFILWVDRFSPKIGIQRRGDVIHVPAFLLSGNRDTVAFLDERGRLVISVSKRTPAFIRNLPLPGASWKATVRPANSRAVAEVREQPNGRFELVVTSDSAAGALLEAVTLEAPVRRDSLGYSISGTAGNVAAR